MKALFINYEVGFIYLQVYIMNKHEQERIHLLNQPHRFTNFTTVSTIDSL